jgi:YidC/Oxa1 family membrane protein insertase
MNLWDTLIQGFVIALTWMYQALGSSEWSLVLSITILTIAVRVALLPFTVPSQRAMKRNSAKMQALQPEIDKIKKKYPKDNQRQQEAQLKLYQERGISPLGSLTGCLPLILQLPVIWAFYQSITRWLANEPGETVALINYLFPVPRFVSLIPLPSTWLWFDLSKPDVIVLPLLVAGSTWLQQKLTTPPTGATGDPQAAQMTQSMTVTMPLMFGFFAMQMPAGLSIYFIVSNLIGMAIQWATNRVFKDDAAGDAARPRRSSASANTQAAGKSTKQPRKRDYRKRGYKKRS